MTGVDLSETFIGHARDRAAREGVSVEFHVSDIRDLACFGTYDIVTWIANSFFDEDSVTRFRQYLTRGGYLVLDARNPEHPKAKSRQGNWRTWREDGGVFHLERHETDAKTGVREDAWITIDPQRDVIEEKVNVDQHPMDLDEKIRVMKRAGFYPVELRTMEGELFLGATGPYWLWLVGRT